MHIVVNHIALKEGADWPRLEAEVDAFNERVRREHPQFLGAALVREGGGRAIFLVRFADLASLQSISSTLAAPWFMQHFKPLLTGPVDRHVGEIVAGDLR